MAASRFSAECSSTAKHYSHFSDKALILTASTISSVVPIPHLLPAETGEQFKAEARNVGPRSSAGYGPSPKFQVFDPYSAQLLKSQTAVLEVVNYFANAEKDKPETKPWGWPWALALAMLDNSIVVRSLPKTSKAGPVLRMFMGYGHGCRWSW